MKNLKRPLSVLILSLFLYGCTQQSKPTVAAATTVVAKNIAHQPIKNSIVLDGTVVPAQQANLIARVPGNLDAVHFKDGENVKKGQLLFSIEPSQYKEQLKLNQAKFEQARSDYARQTELQKENANSKANVETALSNLRQAEANVGLAKINLGYTEVRAPFDGIMGHRQIDPGNYVGGAGAEAVLATITQTSPLYVKAAVGENEAIRLRQYQTAMNKKVASNIDTTKVYAQLQGETKPSETGVLDFIDHKLNSSSGTVTLRGKFENKEHHLVPGFYAKLIIEAKDEHNALVLPRAVVQTDQLGEFVFTVSPENTAQLRRVKSSPLSQAEVEIISGLNPGDKVVMEGYAKINDGQTVQLSGEQS